MWIVNGSIYKHEKNKYLNLDFSGTRLSHKTKTNWTVVLQTYSSHTLCYFPTGNLRVALVCSWGCWDYPTFAEKALVTWRACWGDAGEWPGIRISLLIGGGGALFISLPAKAATLS